MEEDDDDEWVNSDGANTHDEAMVNNTPPLTSNNPTATHDSAGTGILMEPSETTPPRVQRPPTIAERISNLIQVNMEGVPGKCHIFETTFSVDYQGSDSGTVADALLSTVLNSIKEAINNSPHELKILPISDTTYKQQNLWIRNSVDLRNRIPTYRALSTYCDMEYGNCPYAATNSKPGEKKVHTRLRRRRVIPFSVAVWRNCEDRISDWKSAQQGLLSVKAYGPVKDAILTLISKLRDYYILTEVLYPDIDFTGMFKFAITRLYGSCTLFKLLLSIKATPAQADQASTAAKDKSSTATATDDDSSDEEDHETQEGEGSLSGAFTKVTKKKVKKKKKKKKSPLSDTLENHFLKDLSPVQRKLAEATNRKLQNDIDRHKAGPLFLMILPGEMEGSYIFVCRKKYNQLARNVLKGVPFLINHLCELTGTQAEQVLGKWIPKSEIQATRRQLLIDMDMANAKDIDNGQTVTGMLDEMQEREQQLEDAFVEIEAHDNALAAKDQALAQQKAATAALQAQLEALQRQTAHHLAIASQPPTQNNEVSPDRSEFTTPPKKRKSKDSATVKRSVDRSTAGLKQPTKSTRTSTSVHFQQQKQRSWKKSQVHVDTTQMEGDTTTAVSQDESLSSLTAASPGGVHPFFLPSPSRKSGTSGSAKLPSSVGRGAPRSAAGP
ncbi:unnamed protein product [Cylindrotheca closterium]|uniref:Uncharacterized protein n=1 Tax=Cylindrotheca closterium TaxID=2856 RepID=A0AAD2G9Q8_9STRA|nr:unnamed protein product [Cylindrotheca closterium]